mgnify:FL=1
MRIFIHGPLFQGKLTEDLLRISVEQLIKQALPDAQISTIIDVPEELRTPKGLLGWLNAKVTLLLLLGGDLLGRLNIPFLSGSEWLNKRKFDIVIFGAGYRKEDKKLSANEKDALTGLLINAKSLSVRGQKTADMLKKMGVKAEVIGDPVFSFEPSDLSGFMEDLFSIQRPMVAVNLRHLSSEDMGAFKKSLSHDFIEDVFAELLKNDFAEYGKIFLPFTLPSKGNGDAALHGTLTAKYGGELSLKYWNLDKMASFIREVDFLLSMRLHPILLALKFGTPTYLIDYQYDKLADALSAGGLDKATKSLSLFNGNQMEQPFMGMDALQYAEKYKDKAPAIQHAVEKLAETQLQYMKKILKGR